MIWSQNWKINKGFVLDVINVIEQTKGKKMKSKQEKCHYLRKPFFKQVVSLESSKKKQEPNYQNKEIPSIRTIQRTASDSRHGRKLELDSVTQILPPE